MLNLWGYVFTNHTSMKVSVLLPGNSANTVCMTSEKGKVARQQQVVTEAGVRGNLQLLCNWSKAARTGNYKRNQTDCRADTTAKGFIWANTQQLWPRRRLVVLVEILAQIKPFAVVSALQSVWFIYTKSDV